MGAVTLALLVLLSQPAPDCGDLVRCEEARRENLDHALTWEGRAREARVNHRACLAQLAVRTSTPTPAVVEFRAVEESLSVVSLALGATAAFLVGALAGIGLAIAAR